MSAFGDNLTTPYFYIKNLMGDICEIVDKNGASVATYQYDAWGTLLKSEGDESILRMNPLTYRGYLYDTETGLYYLQTRYYNPEWNRFINADTNLDTQTSIIGTNVFAYCDNNPVMNVDPTGKAVALPAVALAIFALIATIFVFATASAILGMPVTDAGDIDFGFIGEHFKTKQLEALIILSVLLMLAGKALDAVTTTIRKVADRLNDKPIFPANPYRFNPIGLKRKIYPGSDNGMIIKWFLGTTPVFRWDEDWKVGMHYHILVGKENSLGIHYWPGMEIPEPYASIYF